MARSTLLKYNFQVRIGDMDGIFVAFHNTEEIFGYQYISRSEMDRVLYGNSFTGDALYSISMKLFTKILNLAAKEFSNSLVRLFVVQRGQSLEVFAERIPSISVLSTFTPSIGDVKHWSVTVDRFLDDELLNPHNGGVPTLQSPSQFSIKYVVHEVELKNLNNYILFREKFIRSHSAGSGKGSLEEVQQRSEFFMRKFKPFFTQPSTR